MPACAPVDKPDDGVLDDVALGVVETVDEAEVVVNVIVVVLVDVEEACVM